MVPGCGSFGSFGSCGVVGGAAVLSRVLLHSTKVQVDWDLNFLEDMSNVWKFKAMI